MTENDHGEDLELIESVIETRGLEEAVRLAFSSGAVRNRRIGCLEEACNVRFGADEARWRAWLDELREKGVVGFGPISQDPQADIPADPGIIAGMICESTGLTCEGPVAVSEDATGILLTRQDISAEADPQRDGDQSASDLGLAEGKRGPDPQPQRLIGNYEIVEKLGEGSMGVVYRARQRSVDRVVAVKLLAGWLSRDQKYVSRFFREARLAAKLDHKNIVRGIDAGSDAGTHFFVMEYVEGESLGEALRRRGSFSERDTLGIAIQITRALVHAWQYGLVHRDIKPDNIIITEDGVAKLADLGLAKSTSDDASHMTQTGTTVGTPHYMSTEQARGDREIDVRADIYSLGATLYHVVTGATPFAASTPILLLNKHLTESPIPAHVRNPDVSVNMSSVIDKMMAKERGDRYADPPQLLDDLLIVAKGRAPRHAAIIGDEARTPAGTRSLMSVEAVGLGRRRGRRWGLLKLLFAAAGAAACAAAVALALYLVFRGSVREGGPTGARPAGAAGQIPESERRADIKAASEAIAKARDLRQAARFEEAVASLDQALRAARLDETRRLVEGERRRLVEEKRAVERLTAADLVRPRQGARQAKASAEKVPAEPALEGLVGQVRGLWDEAEVALQAGDLPKAFVSYRGCRSAAESISSRREGIEACAGAAREASRARGESRGLSRFAETEWRVAENAFRAAERKRLAGEFDEAARSYSAASVAYEEHRGQAVELAREEALARAREAEKEAGGRGNLVAALAAYREAAGYLSAGQAGGADVADKIAVLEDEIARSEAMRRARTLAGREEWKEAADVLVDLLRRRPEDAEASRLFELAAEQAREEPPLVVDLGGGVAMELVYVLPGSFKMGSADGGSDERPVHDVCVTKGFYTGKCEVTQAQYEQVTSEQVTGRNPSYWKDPAKPVERVSWEDASAFCRKLSEMTGARFRLPTEAEWEYAARAGASGRYSFGDDVKELDEFAWYASNSGRETHPVGEKKPNAWGLCDMHGNVWEWCADAYDPAFYGNSPQEDPCCSGAVGTTAVSARPGEGGARVLRGGSWLCKPHHCRSAERIRYRPDARYADVGFRVVCERRSARLQ